MDSLSLKILKVYRSRQTLTLSQLGAILNEDTFSLSEPVILLRKQGYLRVEPNHAALEGIKADDPISVDDPLELTFVGKLDSLCYYHSNCGSQLYQIFFLLTPLP